MENPKAKACPFCGGEIIKPHKLKVAVTLCGYEMLCDSCESTGPFGDTLEQAIERWNERAGDRQPVTPETVGVKALASASGSAASWHETEPPKDGTIIIAVGRVIWHDDLSTSVDSFTGAVMWIKDGSGYEGWHFAKDGMTVARALDDEVKVDYWNMPPNDELKHAEPKT